MGRLGGCGVGCGPGAGSAGAGCRPRERPVAGGAAAAAGEGRLAAPGGRRRVVSGRSGAVAFARDARRGGRAGRRGDLAGGNAGGGKRGSRRLGEFGAAYPGGVPAVFGRWFRDGPLLGVRHGSTGHATDRDGDTATSGRACSGSGWSLRVAAGSRFRRRFDVAACRGDFDPDCDRRRERGHCPGQSVTPAGRPMGAASKSARWRQRKVGRVQRSVARCGAAYDCSFVLCWSLRKACGTPPFLAYPAPGHAFLNSSGGWYTACLRAAAAVLQHSAVSRAVDPWLAALDGLTSLVPLVACAVQRA